MKTYKIDDKSILKIEEKAFNKLLNYCQFGDMNESGGILLGKVRIDYSEYIIVDISEPCKKDKSGRYYFIRNKYKAQKIINKAWKESNGEIIYLGEWHTHPEKNPKPSYIDKKLINQCIKEVENIPPNIFMIIVGQDSSVYIGCKGDKYKLKEIKMK